jgi:hypothetical protein
MKLFKHLKSIKLTKEEKQKSLDFLLARIEPVRNYYNLRHNKQKAPLLHLLTNHKYMLAGLLIAAILAMGGGTAVAAENTVPGDLLYPVKTQINEEVRSALALGDQAKAAWDNQRAERRLQEVEKLAGENKLTTSTSAMLADKFKEFSDKASARLEKLQQNGKLSEEQAQQLKENFEVAVKAHDEVLSRLEERKQVREQLKTVVDSLKAQASSTMKERLEHEWELLKDNTSTTLQTVADNRKNAAQNKIAEVEKFIINNVDKVSAENKTAASEKLTAAKTTVIAGDQLYNGGKYGEAVIKYSEAHRQAQEAKMYLTTRFRLERRMNATSSTPPVFASGTLQFNNEKKQEVWDAKENLKEMEQKLREEVKQAREKAQEVKKDFREKMEEFRKSKPMPATTTVSAATSST